MRNCVILVLSAIVFFFVLLPSLVRADDYPYQSKPVTLDGTVSAVDRDRDRVILAGDDGRQYTLDTSQTDITLLDGNRAGMTDDLLSGMRVHVAGKLLAQAIIEADQIRVLSLQSRRPIAPTIPNVNNAPSVAAGVPITLHGTVISADRTSGSFVVRVNDHTRTVFVSDETDFSGMGRGSRDPLPVDVGDRLTVGGILAGNGSVQADVISLGRALPPVASISHAAHEITGRVTGTSNRYTSRDIKVQITPERELKVHVPSRTPVRRDGQPISVHEISQGDQVRVTGSYDGNDFDATRIDDSPAGTGF